MKRHEQLVIQNQRNNRKIQKAVCDAVNKLTGTQLKVFIQYMKTHKNRMGYETCTPMKMRSQLRRINDISISTHYIRFIFRGSYGDSTGITLPVQFLDNVQGRQAAVDWMKQEMKEKAEIKAIQEIKELRILVRKYPKISKEVLENR